MLNSLLALLLRGMVERSRIENAAVGDTVPVRKVAVLRLFGRRIRFDGNLVVEE
jgi:hypothetical protein